MMNKQLRNLASSPFWQHFGTSLPLLGLLLCQCSGSAAPPVVVLTFAGTVPAATTLRVTTNFDGVTEKAPAEVPASTPTLALPLPAGSSGPLQVQVDALDINQVVIEQGTASAQISGPGRVDLSVALTPVPAPVPVPDPQTCKGFCQQTLPLPGVFLKRTWASGSKDVWAVGDNNTILHYDGSVWTADPISNSSTNRLTGIWGSQSTDVWAVGDTGTILHYDGSRWSQTQSLSAALLTSVWGSGPSDVWVVSGAETILHFDGKTWTSDASLVSSPLNQLWSVWGSDGDVWAAGDAGTVFRRHDGVWRPVQAVPQATNDLNSIWGSDQYDVWISGDQGMLLHYNGTTLSAQPAASGTCANLNSIWGFGPNDVWSVADLKNVTCAANATIVHYDGMKWSPVASGTSGLSSWFYGVWGLSTHDIWVTGKGSTLLHRTQ